MAAKDIFVLCASTLIIQSALGQCFGRMPGSVAPCRAGLGFDGFAYDGFGHEGVWPRRAGCNTIVPTPELAASSGGSLSVSSSSATAPTGLAVTSDNVYEGPVALGGNLPFLGTAEVEGVFSTAGAGAINYGCGDGPVAITAESPVDATIAPAVIAPAVTAPAVIAPAVTTPAALASKTISPATITSPVINSALASWGYKGLPSRGCGCASPSLY